MCFGGLVEARFLVRLNRFAALVDLEGRETLVHMANSGRMRELLAEGNRVWLRPAPGEGRKTAYDLALVEVGHTLVSADARLPNPLVHHAWTAGRLPQFAGYTTLRREVNFGESRLDLMLEGPPGRCYIETKSVTLVVECVGQFPDAPTLRGRKHVASLRRAVEEGHRAAVIFVVQREDADALSPNDSADPEFGLALRHAVEGGVEAYAYRCEVSLEGITLGQSLPVRL